MPFGDTNSNWDASKLGREPCESRDEAIDRWGDSDRAFSDIWRFGGECEESVDDVVSLDLWEDVRWSKAPVLTK